MTIASYKQLMAESLAKALNTSTESILPAISTCPPNIEGDFAFPCFPFAKEMRKAPPLIAKDLAAACTAPLGFSKVIAVGGYVNFCLDKTIFTSQVLNTIYTSGHGFGKSSIGKGKTITIDYSSPNLGKELAFHHLRGTMLGNSLAHILEDCGYKVIRINHLGDWGTSYGKLMVMVLRENKSITTDDLQKLTISDLNLLYQGFAKALEADPSLEDAAREAFAKLEQGQQPYTELWKAFRATTLVELNRIYEMLGVRFDDTRGESFFIDPARKLTAELIESKLAVESEGALVIHLDDLELPPLLLRKSDGSTLYATRDLCAAMYRNTEYKFDANLYIVDNGQSLHFKQCFASLKKIGVDFVDRCEHIPFGLILNKSAEGKWEKGKTRAGQASLLRDVLERATDKIESIIIEKNPELKDRRDIALKIAVGALVFNDLKNKRINDVKFEWDAVLSFEGDTGPYVQNALVRLASIMRKSSMDDVYTSLSSKLSGLDYSALCEPSAQALLTALALWPQKTEEAADIREPSILGQYALELAEKSHAFIHNCRILGSDKETERLLLVYCAHQVLGGVLTQLGVPLIEAM